LKKAVIYALIAQVESDVFIALGANEGDRELNLLRGVAELGRLTETRITALSGFYDTEPVGPVAQGNFLNAVARLETSLSPRRLLEELQRIETAVFRRRREVPGGPRPMDLDILFYGSLVLHEADLTIPHPRLHERRFVLVPLAEIAPDFIHPLLHRSAVELLAGIRTGERVTRI
jgi:2-amino-4-hydroxy-6-hydroxymethyldihydropteridine diphosphokinase